MMLGETLDAGEFPTVLLLVDMEVKTEDRSGGLAGLMAFPRVVHAVKHQAVASPPRRRRRCSAFHSAKRPAAMASRISRMKER